MADEPSTESKKDQETGQPAPEVLKPKADESAQESDAAASVKDGPKPPKRSRRGTYRPSHKATFIGLIVVIAILGINAGIIGFILKRQNNLKSQVNQGQVTISQSALSKLGVNNTPAGDSGIELTVNPNAKFNGKVQVAGDVTVGGGLTLNSTFSASSASLAKLQAGDTSLSKLNVNGDGTLSNLSLRQDLSVTGKTDLTGPLTVSQLITAAAINVTGNLAVGGVLSVRDFHSTSLTSDSTLTIGGHVITAGLAPSISRGTALGSNGTVSISGNDAAGTVAANTGVGASNGEVACVTFRSAYSNIPHVVISANGPVDVYVTRSTGGFCIYVGNNLTVGRGYGFDYIVEQ